MIAKLKKGKGFRGVLNYVLKKEDAWIIGSNLASKGPKGLAKEFAAFREMRPKLGKAVAHASLSVEKEANLSNDQWQEIAEKYLDHMGFGDAGYVVVRHSDTDHDHIHIIASRIRGDGSVVNDSHDYQMHEPLMRALEEEYGLKQVKNSAQAEVKALSKNEVGMSERTGQPPARAELQSLVGAAIKAADNYTDFAAALDSSGVRHEVQLQNKGQKWNGIKFSLDGEVWFKGSDLGKKFTASGLQKNGVSYGKSRDFEAASRNQIQPKAGGNDASEPKGHAEPGAPGASSRDNERSGGSDRGSAGRDQSAVASDSGADRGRGGNGVDAPNKVKKKTKALLMKEHQWSMQHQALNAPRYRITLKGRDDSKKIKEWNLGKGKGPGGKERFWTPEETTEKLAFLSKKNADGYDIYLTPIDDDRHFILVDDMTPEKEKALLDNGYNPALIQESSENNRQAVMICSRDKSDPKEQSYANEVLQGINKKYGDPKVSAVRRPFRMAGFSNKKPDKNSPFTQVVKAVNALCDKTFSLIVAVKKRAAREAEARAKAKAEAAEQRRVAREMKAAELGAKVFDKSMLDESGRKFDQIRNQVIKSAKARGLPVDDSVVDFQAAQQMMMQGYEENDVYLAILQHPETVRKSDPQAYAQKTSEAAEARLTPRVERSDTPTTKPPQRDDFGV